MRLPFVKMHGCGNDYIYIDCREREPSAPLGPGLADPPALSRRLSDRHFGIGGDGIILILPSQQADYRMRVFNADGSEAEMCGNGIRCFAKYLYDRGLVKGDETSIETGAGIRTVQLFAEGGKARRARVNMGLPRTSRPHIPMEGPVCPVVKEDLAVEVPGQGTVTFRITAISMGNPHCVIFVDDTDSFPVQLYGPLIERHRVFPKRTNVEFVQVLSPGEAKMRVWERGSGETLACGTGASAVCVAGALNKKTDRCLLLHLLGGDLELEWADDGSVFLTGPAEEAFEGTVEV